MIDAAGLEERGEEFALLDRDGADEDGAAAVLEVANGLSGDRFLRTRLLVLELDRRVVLAENPPDPPTAVGERERIPPVDPLDLVGDGRPLLFLSTVNDVGVVDPLHAAVCRDGDDVELVDLPKLARLGHGRAGHAAELLVELEEVLKGDGGEGLRLLLDPHSLLRLDRLMEAVGPLPARHQPPGELVDDHHLPLLNDVIHVALVEVVGLEGVVDEMGPLHVARGVEALHPGDLLGAAHARLRQRDRVFLLLDLEVFLGAQLPRDLVGARVLGDVVVGRAGDDQRRAGFVDEDVVDLVDDREVEHALALLLVGGEAIVAAGGHPHVVAEVVEAELVVRAVGDVGRIRLLPLGGIHPRLDRADGQAEAHVERPHPLHVAASEVVVDGDDMDALPLDGIEVGGEGGDERLPLAGHHLGDGAGVEHHAADELDVVVAHAEPTAPRLAADAEGLGEDVVEGLAGSQAAAELGRLPAKLGIGHRLVTRLEGVDRLDLRLEPSQVTRVGRAEHAGQKPLHAVSGGGSGVRDRVPDLFELFHRASFRSAGRKRGSAGAGGT